MAERLSLFCSTYLHDFELLLFNSSGVFVSDGSRIFRDLVVSVQRLLRVLLLQLSAQDTFRRRSQRVEEGRRERHDAPDGDDQEEAEVAVGLLDPLAHGGHQQVVDDVGGEEEGVDGAAVPEKLMKFKVSYFYPVPLDHKATLSY